MLITAAAADLLHRLQDRHGPVMFHQSGGCCDGSSPMCYPDGEFIVGDRDVLLGRRSRVRRCGFPARSSRRGSTPSWSSTWLPGRGGGFSLEAPEGVRFLSRGRAFTDAENELLAAVAPLTGADYEQGARPPARTGSGGRRGRRRLCDTWSARRSRLRRSSATPTYRHMCDTPASGLAAHKCVAGWLRDRSGRRHRSLLLVKASIRPDLVVGLVIGVPSLIGLLLILVRSALG